MTSNPLLEWERAVRTRHHGDQQRKALREAIKEALKESCFEYILRCGSVGILDDEDIPRPKKVKRLAEECHRVQ